MKLILKIIGKIVYIDFSPDLTWSRFLSERLVMKRFLVLLMALFIGLPLIAFGQIDNADCFECHEAESPQSMRQDSALVLSVHSDFLCTDCHTAIEDLPHPEEMPKVHCGSCHEEAEETYKYHGRMSVEDGKDIPGCSDCHGTHKIFSYKDKMSMVNPLHIPETCDRCHEDINLISKHELLYSPQVIISYETSVHGKASLGGVHLAATCNDCHSTGGTAHRILSPGNPVSTINHFNIPKTCGKCHMNIMNDYYEGIHGKLVLQGETDTPVCTDCHGEHGILSPTDPNSTVSPARVAEATCSPCHESAKLNAKYGLLAGRLESWVDSYHGLKSKAGDVTVANCSSCHGAHRILPHTDTTSSIYSANLQHTCGGCHPGISTEMASIPIHSTPGMSQTPIAGHIANIYIIIIIVTIGLMVLHWLLDLRKQIKLVMKKKQISRMTLNAVWQHVFLMATFVVLVITGFSLRYSDAFWVKWLFAWEGGFPLRGIIHRVSAVIFIITSIWHIFYIYTSTGRRFLLDMLPGKEDLAHLWQMVLYNIGRKNERPQFRRFSYVEKVEYWALVWGSIVMIITGLFLWFDDIAVMFFPKGFLDVVLVIHFYEAWLASLAILIWHMYSTIFSPAVYPMNPSWINGKMPEESYKHEHPGDPMFKKYETEKSAQISDKEKMNSEPKDDKIF